jgi:NADPH:quinone reductase-like Zn-dependent oxidoreductase
MKAAVVRSYTNLPQYQELPDPDPGPGEVLINVTAAALSPLVKGQAAGRHYSSKAGFPFVPGVDGVGKLSDGRRVYFAFPNHPHGSMSAKTVVDASLYIPLPDEVDDITAAAAANPGDVILGRPYRTCEICCWRIRPYQRCDRGSRPTCDSNLQISWRP